jgi:hypothetical protein
MIIIERTITLSEAMTSLRPGYPWIIRGEDIYDNLEWIGAPEDKPTREECDQEIARLQTKWDSEIYKKRRKLEYPDFQEYLDGVVKGDQTQIDKYIEDCLAVKAKYPKPEVE